MKKVLVALVGTVVMAAAPVESDAQLASGQWYAFEFGAAGSIGNSCALCGSFSAPPATMWTYASSRAFTFTIQDAFLAGDRFELYANNSSAGLTSVPGFGSCWDINNCVGDSNMSRGSFAFAPGNYSFQIRTNATPFGSGAALMRIDETEVPEPSTAALLLIGGVGLVARRRRNAVN
jgi:hypothetical protein